MPGVAPIQHVWVCLSKAYANPMLGAPNVQQHMNSTFEAPAGAAKIRGGTHPKKEEQTNSSLDTQKLNKSRIRRLRHLVGIVVLEGSGKTGGSGGGAPHRKMGVWGAEPPHKSASSISSTSNTSSTSSTSSTSRTSSTCSVCSISSISCTSSTSSTSSISSASSTSSASSASSICSTSSATLAGCIQDSWHALTFYMIVSACSCTSFVGWMSNTIGNTWFSNIDVPTPYNNKFV
jgi:hypothetical protein